MWFLLQVKKSNENLDTHFRHSTLMMHYIK